ncbi:MAG: CDP-alcohol phosphatidyltransferase family protein [Alkalispirochaeta sp.]
MTFDRAYQWWNLAHAAVILAAVASVVVPVELGGAALVPVAEGTILRVLAGWGVVALGGLYGAARLRDRRRPKTGRARSHWLPDLCTAVRGATAGGLLWMLPAAQGWSEETMWIVVAVLAVVEVTDFLDGKLARIVGPSSFGALWDMENDALFTLSLSLLVYIRYDVAPVLLLLGLMRYVYVLVWRFHRDPVCVPSSYKWFAKTTAAAIVVTLIASAVPIIPDDVRGAALATVLTMQVVSFGWDLALQYRALRVSGPR